MVDDWHQFVMSLSQNEFLIAIVVQMLKYIGDECPQWCFRGENRYLGEPLIPPSEEREMVSGYGENQT